MKINTNIIIPGYLTLPQSFFSPTSTHVHTQTHTSSMKQALFLPWLNGWSLFFLPFGAFLLPTGLMDRILN